MKESVERLTLGEKQTSDWDGSKERSELKGGMYIRDVYYLWRLRSKKMRRRCASGMRVAKFRGV